MANLGFFAGGLANSLNQGFARNQQADFQQQELQIQQQAQDNAQKRFDMARLDTLLSDAGKHLSDTIDALKSTGTDPKKIQSIIQGTFDNYRRLSTAAGYPGVADANLAAWMAAPPSTAVTQAQAVAKETPSVRAERESMAAYRKSLADPFGLQSGPGTGNTFQPGTILGESSVEELPPGAPLPIKGGTQVAQATPQPTVKGSGQGPSGDAFLSTLPPQTAQAVKAVGDYEMDPSSLLSRGTLQARTQFLGLVKEYNPSFDVKEYKARNAAYTAFANPNSNVGKSLRSFNVLTSHLDVLDQATRALKNNGPKALNALKNTFVEQFGGTAPTDFAGIKAIVGDELTKAILGSGGALGDRETFQKSLDRANSEEQLLSLIGKYEKLAGGQLEGLRKSYEEGTGRKDFDRFLLPSAKRQFGQGTQESGSKRYKFNPDTGELE